MLVTSLLFTTRDSNPGPDFTVPGFGIETFLMPGSRRDYAVGRYFSKLDKSTKVDKTESAEGRGPDSIHIPHGFYSQGHRVVLWCP